MLPGIQKLCSFWSFVVLPFLYSYYNYYRHVLLVEYCTIIWRNSILNSFPTSAPPSTLPPSGPSSPHSRGGEAKGKGRGLIPAKPEANPIPNRKCKLLAEFVRRRKTTKSWRLVGKGTIGGPRGGFAVAVRGPQSSGLDRRLGLYPSPVRGSPLTHLLPLLPPVQFCIEWQGWQHGHLEREIEREELINPPAHTPESRFGLPTSFLD